MLDHFCDFRNLRGRKIAKTIKHPGIHLWQNLSLMGKIGKTTVEQNKGMIQKTQMSVSVGNSVLSVLMGLLAINSFFIALSMGQGLYQPGMMASPTNLRASLTPPPQSGDPDFWTMEPGIRLHHFSRGEGRNVLVIHGGPGRPQKKPWAGLELLTNSYRFVYYDQRGCGESTRPVDRFASPNYYQNMQQLDASLGLAAQIADIERIRRLLGDQKLILIGHSFGCFLATMYASEFPSNVASLVLVAPADVLISPSQSGGLFEEVKNHLPPEHRSEYEQWLGRYFDFQTIFSKDEAALAALNDEFGKYYRSVTSGKFPEAGKTGGWIAFATYFSMGRQHDYRPALKSVLAPVLIIHGSKDLQPESSCDEYTRGLPNTRMCSIEGAEHFSFYTHPTEFAAEVRRFLSQPTAGHN